MEQSTVVSVHVVSSDIERWFDSAPEVATLELCMSLEALLALSE